MAEWEPGSGFRLPDLTPGHGLLLFLLLISFYFCATGPAVSLGLVMLHGSASAGRDAPPAGRSAVFSSDFI